MNATTATLVAASIAATASILTLILRVGSEWRTELRKVNRSRLEPHVADLGDAIHKIVATSVLSVRDERTANVEYWRKLKADARRTLRQLRRTLRYPLWGLDDGIKALICLPDWVTPDDSADYDAVLLAATKLRASLDNSIRRCYRDGRPPTLFERVVVQLYVARLRREWHGLKDALVEEDLQQVKRQVTKHEKTYATVVSRTEDEFIAETVEGEHVTVFVSNRSGKGSRDNVQPGVKVKLYQRDGEDFLRYRFVGG